MELVKSEEAVGAVGLLGFHHHYPCTLMHVSSARVECLLVNLGLISALYSAQLHINGN